MSSSLLVLAAAAPAAGPPGWVQILPLLAMGVIFWFLVFRPQMKRQKEHQTKIAGLQKGDRVVTAGGLIGKIVRLDDQYVDIELAPNVKVKAVRATIGDVIPAGGTPAND